jgi:hypothetical protein
MPSTPAYGCGYIGINSDGPEHRRESAGLLGGRSPQESLQERCAIEVADGRLNVTKAEKRRPLERVTR